MAEAWREFSRSEYRRQVGWTKRIQREAPFLESLLTDVPSDSMVVDLGCGTGEHARFLAERGFTALGIDLSWPAVRVASREPCQGRAAWARGDLTRLPVRGGAAGAAFCLGNTLVILGVDSGIESALSELRRVLTPGGVLLIQILNYHRLRTKEIRNLPLNFRGGEGSEKDAELVYVRLMDFDEPDHVDFHVITLRRRRGEDEPSVVEAVRRRLRSLRYDELHEMLTRVGFDEVRLFGDYSGAPFDPLKSSDVIAVARRSP